ncbi:sperm flagellar protein 1 isoform X1 [Coturnix japonica]|uniref:sperm flagellar protein 1 isoform X1 n=1 Tax=Coturnix japonica TaxID=93934 RepID=UPI0007776966|nr:sperm flagellar protein 1 isoform X1 [Coturnix japonica]
MAAALGGGEPGEGGLRALYRWVDAVPLSRPRRNIARDFSDGVLVAEVVKFFFPALVQLHSFVPASSTPQKLANWGHLNRKVLSKLNFSVPSEVIRQVVQCQPGVVEQVLLLLRQKIEEKQKQVKAAPGHGQFSLQEPGLQAAQEISYMDTGKAGCTKGRSTGGGCTGGGCTQETPTAVGGHEIQQHGAQSMGENTAAMRLQLAEREQALLLAQETVQILQMKVRRLEQLLHLKDTRIDDLSRCLQRAQLHNQNQNQLHNQNQLQHQPQPQPQLRLHQR